MTVGMSRPSSVASHDRPRTAGGNAGGSAGCSPLRPGAGRVRAACRRGPRDRGGFPRALFGEPRRAHALLAEIDGAAVGFAVWFYDFSTFEGCPGLFVEDVFVDPEQRGQGIGRAIFAWLARRALREGCTRMNWSVLDWNAPSIAFYRGLGAVAQDEWTVQRLSGDALAALARME